MFFRGSSNLFLRKLDICNNLPKYGLYLYGISMCIYCNVYLVRDIKFSKKNF